MIRTDDDLREALARRADELLRLDDRDRAVLTSPRRGRLEWRPSLVAAAVVAAIAVTVAIVPSTHHRVGTAASGPGNAPAWFDPRDSYFSLNLTPFAVVVVTSGTATQTLRVTGDGTTVAQIDARSAAAPALPDEGSRPNVTINGRLGVLTTSDRALRLTWMYADNAWATLTSPNPLPSPAQVSSEQAIAIARAFLLRTPQALAVPFRLAALPPGDSLQGLRSCIAGCTQDPGAIAFFGPSPTDANVLSVDVEGAHARAAMSDTPPDGSVPVHVNGLTGWWLDDTTLVLLGTGTVVIVSARPDAHAGATPSKAVILAAADGLTLAPDMADPATWYPAPVAIP